MDVKREEAFGLFVKWRDEPILLGLDVASAAGLRLRFVGWLRDVSDEVLVIVSESGFDRVSLPLSADVVFTYLDPR